MRYRRIALEKSGLPINQVFAAYLHQPLDPADPLEPYQFQCPAGVTQLRHQPPALPVSEHLHTDDLARHLDIIRIRTDILYQLDPGPVHMPVGKMIQKVRKGEYAQFLLQELCPQRAHAFQIFDRVTQYCYDILYFFTKIKTRVINFAAILNRYSIPMTRKLSVTAIAGILLVIAASGANAQFKEGFNDVSMRIPQGKDTPEIKAAIWLPGGYDTARRYPLIIYAQPNTEADSGANDLLNEGLPAVLKGGFRPPFDCIVICPRGEAGIPQPGWLSGMIGDAVGQLPIDSTRIYLTGMAEGGYLCFGSQLNLSPDVARKIAAICVVSGNTENL